MASTKGDNLDRNWRGANRTSTVKKAGPYYSSPESNSMSGRLVVGTQITYIDSATENYQKAAIQFAGDQNIYYTHIDNLVKPRTSARSGVRLSPGSFGLDNRTFNSPYDYYNTIKSGINARKADDIDGELFDYLYELLAYAKDGTQDYVNIVLSDFPWGQIQTYYAEVLGPLACCYRGLLSRFVPEGLGSATIFMPPDSERLYDYKLITGSNEYLISAKAAKGVSNQVKPQFVVDAVSGILPFNLSSSTAYQLLQILKDNSVILGAFKGWQLIQPTEITNACISDVMSNYNNTSRINPNTIDIWDSFVRKHLPHRVTTKSEGTGKNRRTVSTIETTTYGELRYKCEQLIETWSKSGTQNSDLRAIFNLYLSRSRVIYVKMNLNKTNGVASFTADGGSGSSLVNSLYLRTSNYATRTADKIGFQVS